MANDPLAPPIAGPNAGQIANPPNSTSGPKNTTTTGNLDNSGDSNPVLGPPSPAQVQAKAQTDTFKAFGQFEPAIGPGFKTTDQLIADQLQGNVRPNSPMADIDPWECRIGGSHFFVPPVNIQVSQMFIAGSRDAAIRQSTPVRFNTGKSQTQISMSLYFPTHESIWGFEGDNLTINYISDTDQTIDSYMSSLRGLITQFKFMPVLPVKNAYLNEVHKITGVCMQSLTISTVEGFPFCLVANLTMLKFNHKVFLPMIGDDFNNAIHWGRFREMAVRGARKMEDIVSKSFLTTANSLSNNITPLVGAGPLLPNQTRAGRDQEVMFDKRTDWLEGSNIELYYPSEDPALTVTPDLTYWKADHSNSATGGWWTQVTRYLGIDPNTPLSAYAVVQGYPNETRLANEFNILKDWLQHNKVGWGAMTQAVLNEYQDSRTHGLNTDEAKAKVKADATAAWLGQIYKGYLDDPALQSIFDVQQFLRGQIHINEWEVPMRQLGINNSNVHVTSVKATIANNFVPLQLDLQDEPTYQHIGGFGVTIQIGMTIFGEKDVASIRLMFDTINGLARLEHQHSVLGFFGIKNVITGLAGCKYAIPQSFEVSSVPNYPHVYQVQLTFLDFDVFQQKRELLSSEQQQELIEAFSKKNPFLRIQQLWGMFNAYPDFPLSVRDGGGKIVGQLDPDYYFRSFKGIDDDVMNWRTTKQAQFRSQKQKNADQLNALAQSVSTLTQPAQANIQPKNIRDYDVVHHMSNLSDDGTPIGIGLHANGFDMLQNNQAVATDCTFNEPITSNMLVTPAVPGCVPAAVHQAPYHDGSSNPDSQFDAMFQDTGYRDKTGRMVRVFPTYMLWLIDEGGKIYGQKAFDNFYGLQSVIDMSIVRSEDILGDVLVLRISNLYSHLSTPFKYEIDNKYFPLIASILNHPLDLARNELSGFTNYLVRLEDVELKPGVRVHLRLGYSSNPNKLETVFNGTVTKVEQGDILTVTCQSDAIELSAVVNNKNTKGDSGKIDGSMLGSMNMSEPRDLMTRLMSEGGSTFRETIAHMTQGRIFSENRFGIRHFGSILYEPLTPSEVKNSTSVGDFLAEAVGPLDKFFSENISGIKNTIGDKSPAGIISAGVGDLMSNAWVNFHRKRDYELYRRNIYPGNGSGVAQWMGGDLGDGGVATAFMPEGLAPGQALPTTDPRDIIAAAKKDQSKGAKSQGLSGVQHQSHPFLSILGLTSPDGLDTDVRGFHEVTFRANTYMKSVWDLFLTCAALLPNYVVAVRPFMDRSTVFYGKPHWMYTSGVIPVSKGLKEADPFPPLTPPNVGGMDQVVRDIEKARNKPDDFYDKIAGLSAQGWGEPNSDPNASNAGINNSGVTAVGDDNPPGINAFMAAVRKVESNGNYQDGNGGAYQILPSNWPSWKKEAGVNDSSSVAEQASPAIQDQVAKVKMTGMWNATHDWRSVAQIWNGGHVGANTTMVINSASGQRMHYEDAVLSWMPKFQGATPTGATAANQTGTQPAPSASDLPGWIKDSHSRQLAGTQQAIAAGKQLFSRDLPNEFSYHWGYLAEDSDVPVIFTGQIKNPDGSVVHDILGENAKKVYSDQRSDDDANSIWKEFRERFSGEKETINAFKAHYPDQPDSMYQNIVAAFQEFMWRGGNGFHRGWIVLTADRQVNLGDLVTGDVKDVLVGAGDIPFVGGVAQGAIGAAVGPVPLLGDALNEVNNIGADIGNFLGIGGTSSHTWNFDRAHKLFEVWVTQGNAAAIEWIKAHMTPGKDQTGLLSRGIEELKTKVWDHLWNFFNSIRKAVGSALTGITNTIRMAMVTLTGGLNLSAYSGRQANVLNRVFNDSIYFNADSPGTLLYFCDNPFTREYGEPVVEIREPFQRMHHIDSFSHILHDGICENTDDVATVITATSNQKHPVTVYFDKSAPSEKQVEKSVDTDLFWDKPGIIGSFLHPSAFIRDFIKHFNGSEDETSAKRVALWHLKKNLQQIYGGEILVLGDPSIRPFDLVHMDDNYERVRGMFECRQVVHHFTPDMGFVTAITPAAIVTINDPGRWTVGSEARRWWAVHSLKKELRAQVGSSSLLDKAESITTFGKNYDASSSTYNKQLSIDDLTQRLDIGIQNSQQFHGGFTQIIKDFGGMHGIGGIIAGTLLGPYGSWLGFKWVRDHLLDAHGCYIEYLTKHGKPMDAGLSFNHGVAVGQVHSYSLMGDVLGINIPYKLDGSFVITQEQMLQNLGWNEEDMSNLHDNYISMWEDKVNKQLLDLSNREPESQPMIPPKVYIVTPIEAITGDTIRIAPNINGNFIVRLNFITVTATGLGAEEARKHAQKRLIDDQTALGYEPSIAIRVDPTNSTNQFGQLRGTIFNNVPASITPDQRDAYLSASARDYPNTTWDSFLADGRARTLNYEMMLDGFAHISTDNLTTSLPGRGVSGAGQ